MTRFDYRPSRIEPFLGRRPAFAVDRTLRPALAALAAALVLVACVAGAERARIAALDAQIAALAERDAAAERDERRAVALDAAVRRLRDADRAMTGARRATAAAADAVVRIGNRLPPSTWLTAVRGAGDGTVTIAGRSARLDEIATMLGVAGSAAPATTARLVSVASSGGAGTLLDFTIAMEPQR